MADSPAIDDFTFSIDEACSRMDKFRVICYTVRSALRPHSISRRHRERLRPSEQYTEYQRQEKSVERSVENDRVFPLETVKLQQFNRAYDADINEATIHIGPYADEYARSFNASALTIGRDIFFRNNAFDTGNEEGRKTLAHELVHVAQHEEGRLDGNDSLDELEREAKAFEKQEGNEGGLYCMIAINRRLYKIKMTDIDMLAEQLAENIDRKVRDLWYIMDEEDKLKMLTEYQSLLKSRNGIFDAIIYAGGICNGKYDA